MTTLTITIGLPASGKTTLARQWVAENPVQRARVNRDDLRSMAHAGAYVAQSAETPGTERAILAARDALIKTLLQRGIDVINDDTNLAQRHVRDLKRLADLTQAEFAVIDLTHVPLGACIARDRVRTPSVGEAVIRDMWTRYLKHRSSPKPEADMSTSQGPKPYVPPPQARRAVLVDIDGTVALKGTRSPFDESRVHEDRPNAPVIATVQALHATGRAIIFMSGRTDACRAETAAWLRKHVRIPFHALHMRKAGDMRKDAIVKAELFDAHVRDRFHVLLVLDDRQQVVDMWRSMGLCVFQVAEGDF